MKTAFLKPKKGAVVRQPERNFTIMPEEGANVPMTPFYVRRLRDGDVEKSTAPESPKPEKGKN